MFQQKIKKKERMEKKDLLIIQLFKTSVLILCS